MISDLNLRNDNIEMTDLIFVKTKLRMQTKEYRNTEVHSIEIKEYKNTVIEKYRNIEVHKYRYTDLQIYKHCQRHNVPEG